MSAHADSSLGNGLFQKRFNAIREAIASPEFARELEELRVTLGEPHLRTTGPLRSLTAEELKRDFDVARRPHQHMRPRAHTNSEHGENFALTHVEHHMQTCQRLARHYLHSKDAWPLVHEEARHPGTMERLLRRLHLPEATDGLASTLAADSSGASWSGMPTGPARARRKFAQARAQDYEAAYEAALAEFVLPKIVS